MLVHLSEQLAAEGDTVLVGEAIAVVDESGSAAIAASQAEAAPAVAEVKHQKQLLHQYKKHLKLEEAASRQTVIASPAASKLAREKGIDLTAVPAVDPLGRVRVQDVEAASKAPVQAAPAQPAAQSSICSS